MTPSTAAAVDPLAPWRARLRRGDRTTSRRRSSVACSGGADSLALLALAVDAGLEPVAVHVDHGLRAESAGEAEHVRALATGLGAGVPR